MSFAMATQRVGQDVQLTVNGLQASMSNGLLTVGFKENGTVQSLIKNNVELAHNIVANKDTFYVDYYADGKGRPLTVDELKVITNNADEAHIAYIDKTGMLYIEYHIVMKKGESGLYCYTVVKNNFEKEFKLSELRSVYRLDTGIFDHAYNAERKGRQPLRSYMTQYKKIQDETYELPDGELYTNGKIYSKYDYASYFKDNSFWGQYGNGFGFWFIPVSTEYYPSGPLKQDLLVHYDAITLNYMTSAHFGTGDFTVPVNWEKLYGPWYIYINTGNEEELIRDAEEKATTEGKKWPYTWVNEPLYPIQRASVTGKLDMTHNRSSEDAIVVLAKSGGDYIRQKGDYIFYSKADQNGNFKLNNVRPGTYTLYAYATKGDVTRELNKDNIVVNKNNVNMGTVSWDPPYHRNKLWQIGVADRTAKEFKYGNELRNHKWQAAVPENLDYVVGKSNDSEDWFFAQTKPGDWNLRFIMQNVTKKNFYLMVAMAAFSKGGIYGKDGNVDIKVNGQTIKTVTYPNDATIYRSGNKSGWYHLEEMEISSDMLHVGENIITFTNNNSAVMYDTIVLESD
jgi:rhamnogalacturonan endolyase